MDVSQGLAKRKATRPVIVAITMEGVEFSNLPIRDGAEQLEASGAALHVLAVGSPCRSRWTDEMRNRNQVICRRHERTGGRRDQS